MARTYTFMAVALVGILAMVPSTAHAQYYLPPGVAPVVQLPGEYVPTPVCRVIYQPVCRMTCNMFGCFNQCVTVPRQVCGNF